ncbi:hypothetical protein ACA910_013713 [Epithemia clementina (nom. ined.)]
MKLSTLTLVYLFSFTTALNHLRNPNSRQSFASSSAVEQEALPSKTGQDQNHVQEMHGSDVNIISRGRKNGLDKKERLAQVVKNKKNQAVAIARTSAIQRHVKESEDKKGKDDKKPNETTKKSDDTKSKESSSKKEKTTKNSGGGSSSTSTFIPRTPSLDKALCSCQATKNAITGYWSTNGCTCNPNNGQTDANGVVMFSCKGTRSGVSFSQDGRMHYYCPDGRRYLRA